MPALTIVYWRDIPAQVIVGKGRSGAKAPLMVLFVIGALALVATVAGLVVLLGGK